MTSQNFSRPNSGPASGQKPAGSHEPARGFAGELPPIIAAPLPAHLVHEPADPYAAFTNPLPSDPYAPSGADRFAPHNKPAAKGKSSSAMPVILAVAAIVGGFVVLAGCGGLLLTLLVVRQDAGSSPRFSSRSTPPRTIIRTPTYPVPSRTYVAPPPTPYTPPTFRVPPPMGGDVSESLRESQRMFDELRDEQQRMLDEQRQQMERQLQQQMEESRQRQFREQIRSGPFPPGMRFGPPTRPGRPN